MTETRESSSTYDPEVSWILFGLALVALYGVYDGISHLYAEPARGIVVGGISAGYLLAFFFAGLREAVLAEKV
jgi:hypothetical protein